MELWPLTRNPVQALRQPAVDVKSQCAMGERRHCPFIQRHSEARQALIIVKRETQSGRPQNPLARLILKPEVKCPNYLGINLEGPVLLLHNAHAEGGGG